MRTHSSVRALAVLHGLALSVATLHAAAAAPAVPVEAYGELPSVENVAISPDGTRLAFVRSEDTGRFIAVVDLATGKVLSGVREGDVAKVRDLTWADDRMLLIVSSSTAKVFGLSGKRHEYSMLALLDTVSSHVTFLPRPIPGQRMMNVIWDVPMIRRVDGHTILFIPGIYITDRTLPALFRFDLATGEQQLLFKAEETLEQWFIGENGDLVARVDYWENSHRWSVGVRRNGAFEGAWLGESDASIPEIGGFGTNGSSLLVGSELSGQPVWRNVLLNGEHTFGDMPALTGLDERIVDPLSGYLLGGSTTEDSKIYSFVDPDLQRRWNSVVAAFPGERVTLGSISAGFAHVVVTVDGAKHGLARFLIDTKSNQAQPLGPVYNGITQTFETRSISYAAADGMKIPGYLTLPRNPASKLPLIVLPHGGPAARDTADFDWWAQALASQGYAVLQPNFRGSALGWDFVSAGFGEWGRKMQTDLSDGVRYLAKEGLIDPARVCIAGASYGGYAALAGVTLDPGVYRCAVSVAGLADLPAFLQWVDEKHPYGENTARRFWNRFMGATDNNDPILKTLSPSLQAGRVTVPVLLIHGKDDTVVPYDQSTRMLKALKHAGKNVQLVTLKHEDHWLSRRETRLTMLEETVKFLRANNPPD